MSPRVEAVLRALAEDLRAQAAADRSRRALQEASGALTAADHDELVAVLLAGHGVTRDAEGAFWHGGARVSRDEVVRIVGVAP